MARPTWLTRNLAVLSGVSLAQDAASEMLYPVIPLLLTRVLGAPDAAVGIVEGVAEGVASVAKYAAGRVSDRLGRKPLVGAGYGLAAVGKVITALASVWPLVLLGRAVDRLGKGVRGAPRDALLATDVDDRHLGSIFGFHRAADTTGAVLGPAVCLGILAVTAGNIRTAVWVAVIPALISVSLVALVREKRTPAPAAEKAPQSADATPLSPRFRRVVTVLAVFSLVNFPDTLILLRVSQDGFSETAVVGAYLLYNAVYALISYPAGALSDRLSADRVYALGLLCFAAGYIGLGVVHSAALVVLILSVYGGFNGFTDAVGKAWITNLAGPRARGRAQGVFQATTGAAVLVAGIWAGLAWDLGPGNGVIPLLVSGSLGAVAALLLPVLVRSRTPDSVTTP